MKWMWGVLLGAITTNTAMNLSVKSIGIGLNSVANSINFPKPHCLESMNGILHVSGKNQVILNFKIHDAQTGLGVGNATLDLIQVNGNAKKLKSNAEGYCQGEFNKGDHYELNVSCEGYEAEYLVLDLPENKEYITRSVQVSLLPKAKKGKKPAQQQAAMPM